MRQIAALILVVILAFGLSYALDRSEREGSAYKLCVAQEESRTQGNVRADHLKALESALIESNEKAQSQLPGYTPPASIGALRAGAPIEKLPEIQC